MQGLLTVRLPIELRFGKSSCSWLSCISIWCSWPTMNGRRFTWPSASLSLSAFAWSSFPFSCCRSGTTRGTSTNFSRREEKKANRRKKSGREARWILSWWKASRQRLIRWSIQILWHSRHFILSKLMKRKKKEAKAHREISVNSHLQLMIIKKTR